MSGWLRRVVLRNFSLKVIALALAVLLHILVRPANHGRPSARRAKATRAKQASPARGPDAQPRPGAAPRRAGRHRAVPPASQPTTTRPTSLPAR